MNYLPSTYHSLPFVWLELFRREDDGQVGCHKEDAEKKEKVRRRLRHDGPCQRGHILARVSQTYAFVHPHVTSFHLSHQPHLWVSCSDIVKGTLAT